MEPFGPLPTFVAAELKERSVTRGRLTSWLRNSLNDSSIMITELRPFSGRPFCLWDHTPAGHPRRMGMNVLATVFYTRRGLPHEYAKSLKLTVCAPTERAYMTNKNTVRLAPGPDAIAFNL